VTVGGLSHRQPPSLEMNGQRIETLFSSPFNREKQRLRMGSLTILSRFLCASERFQLVASKRSLKSYPIEDQTIESSPGHSLQIAHDFRDDIVRWM